MPITKIAHVHLDDLVGYDIAKKKLIDNNMTAAQLADALGTTPQYLNKILHGDRSGEKYIEKIREILNIAA